MNHQRICTVVLAIYAAIWTALWAFVSLDQLAAVTSRFLAVVLDVLTDSAGHTVALKIGGFAVSFTINGLLGALCFLALRPDKAKRQYSRWFLLVWIIGFAAEIASLLSLLHPSLVQSFSFFIGPAYLAAALCYVLIRLRIRYPRLLGRETLCYVFFGALTTIVNIVLAIISYRLLLTATASMIANLLSNVIAWIGAVLFAYTVNRRFVFCSHTCGKQAMREFGLFVTARLLSFGIDALGMVLLVDVLPCPYGLAKIAMNVIVLILNYIFSKRIIFRKV